MSAHPTEPDGRLVLAAARHRVELAADGRRLTLQASDGTPLATLRPLAALDRVDAYDETLAVEPPVLVDGKTAEVRRRSTIWADASCTIACGVSCAVSTMLPML